LPVYDYKCLTCGHRFDKQQPMRAEPVSICPRCGGWVERVITAGVGFVNKTKEAVAARMTRCGHDSPCCGRATPCESPACKH